MKIDDLKRKLQGQGGKVVYMTYRNGVERKKTFRYVHPYSIREGKDNVFYLYASDDSHPTAIRKFLLSGIVELEVTEVPFSPQWKVEF